MVQARHLLRGRRRPRFLCRTHGDGGFSDCLYTHLTLPTIADDTASQGAPVDTTNPGVAADEDLIEKEWVEKAKKVVAETRHDPYLQGQEVSKLQADYLQKRYGKTVGLPSDGA